MAFKAVVAICAAALFVQIANSQYAPGIAAPLGLGLGLAGPGLVGPGLAAPGLAGVGCGCGGVASTGGGLPVASASPIAPVGVSVLSENAYEGVLGAGGNLPFLGTVAFEGVLPTAGAGAVSYGCGNGAVGIVSEGPIATGILAPGDFAPTAGLINNGIGPYGLGYGINGIEGYGIGGIGIGPGCGCSAIY